MHSAVPSAVVGSAVVGSPSREWFVTDRREVVGPVSTSRLVRGVATGLVGDDCLAWYDGWRGWRPVGTVREVGALRKARIERGASWVPPHAWSPKVFEGAQLSRALGSVARAGDAGEVALLALHAARTTTGATVGLVHRPRSVFGALDTRAAFGERSLGERAFGRLGGVVRPCDPAIHAARMGARLIASPLRSRVGSASVARLTGGALPLKGVALAPIYAGMRLVAVLELGHDQHAFRHGDVTTLRAIARAASARLGSL